MFFYCECPECEYSVVSESSEEWCFLCAGDSGHDVQMHCREAAASDKPEGGDARKEEKQ
jgi:hypothetical protein